MKWVFKNQFIGNVHDLSPREETQGGDMSHLVSVKEICKVIHYENAERPAKDKPALH